MTPAADGEPAVFRPLPGRTIDRSAEYAAVLRDLLALVGAEVDVPDDDRLWRHRARRQVGKSVAAAGTAPDEWFAPLIRAAVLEPDPSFVRQLVDPARAAFGRRRVRVALLDYLESGAPPDAGGASRAWYWTLVPLTFKAGSRTPTKKSVRKRAKFRDLDRRYAEVALRRFVADDDLDMRRCLLPSLRLSADGYPPEMHDLVRRAVQIARTSDDEYLRHRVGIQTG